MTQEVNLNYKVSHDTLLIGNSFNVTYHIENLEGDLSIPRLDNCELIGPNVSSRYQSINGQVSQSKSYSLTIIPSVEGLFIIPSLEFITQDKNLETEEIEVMVLANPNGIIENNSMGRSGFFQQWISPDKKSSKPKPSTKRKTRKI